MKKWIIWFLGIIILFILLIGVYFSPLGDMFLKKYLKEKICYSDKFKITYFNHSINTFSASFVNKNGVLQIFGTFLPFDASFNGNFTNINFLIPYLKGPFNSTGEIFEKNNRYFAKGDFVYSKGYGDINLTCKNKKFYGQINGKNFNTKSLLNNIKNFHFPLFNKIPISGRNDIKININKDINIKSNFKGWGNINSIEFPLSSYITINILNPENFTFSSEIYSNKIFGKINGIKEGTLKINGNLKNFDIGLVSKNLLFPVRGIVPLNFKYDDESKIFNFNSTYFGGYFDGHTINIQLKMLLKKFFYFLNLPQLLKGQISGNIIINNNKGYFNLLIENANFLPTKIIKKLDNLLNIKLEKIKSIFFFNGSFDGEKIIFDFISKNPKYYIYLKKGIYYYEGLFNFTFDLKTKNEYYKIQMTNTQIKIIKHNYLDPHYKTLVY